jgi:uncharacterized protein (TIGR02996 family)
MTPRTIHDAFLADIAAQPADDAPRLIYADWLEENGQSERAELIRVQCAIVAEESYPGDRWCAEAGGQLRVGTKDCFKCRPCCLRRREKELLGVVTGRECLRWVDAGLSAEKWEWRRGFIASISLPCAAFLQHAADIIEVVPMLEEVRLSDKRPGKLTENETCNRCYWWIAGEGGDHTAHRHFLPTELTRHITDFVYNSPEIAYAVSSTACLAFAREQLISRLSPLR